MLQEITGPDGFQPFLDEVERQREPVQRGAGEDSHRLRVLMGQQGQKGRYRAEPGREEDEEGQFLFRIDGDLVECGQQFPVGAFRAGWVRVEKVATFQRVWKHAEGSLPGTVQ